MGNVKYKGMINNKSLNDVDDKCINCKSSKSCQRYGYPCDDC